MNLSKPYKEWQKKCPEEKNGMIKKTSMPNRWAMKIKAHNDRKKKEKKQ